MVERIVELGDAGSVQLTVAPAQAGFNQIHLYLFDPDGRPAEIAESVTLVMSLPSADLGPITREAVAGRPRPLPARRQRPGAWRAPGPSRCRRASTASPRSRDHRGPDRAVSEA